MFEKEKEAFEELNRRLRQKEMNLTVICAGGYVLSRHESVGDSHQLTHFSIPLSTLNIRDSETYLAAVLTSLSAQ